MNKYNHPSNMYPEDPSREYPVQGRLFDPDDYSSPPKQYTITPNKGKEDLKNYAHELGMIKDLLTALLNRIDVLEEMVSMQTEVLDELSDTLLDP